MESSTKFRFILGKSIILYDSTSHYQTVKSLQIEDKQEKSLVALIIAFGSKFGLAISNFQYETEPTSSGRGERGQSLYFDQFSRIENDFLHIRVLQIRNLRLSHAYGE